MRWKGEFAQSADLGRSRLGEKHEILFRRLTVSEDVKTNA